MKLSDLPRDKTGWIFLPCGALIVDADEDVQAEHVPYCATCAGQIDHVQKCDGGDGCPAATHESYCWRNHPAPEPSDSQTGADHVR